MLRIKDGKIIRLEELVTSLTVALEDGSYAYSEIAHGDDILSFIKRGKESEERAMKEKSLEDEDPLSLVFISTLPWRGFSSLIQPVPLFPADSNPRITWGRIREDGDIFLLPVSILANHVLADGRHVASFFSFFEEEECGRGQESTLTLFAVIPPSSTRVFVYP